MREALLSLLYKEPAHGYELKLAIESMFGELWPAVNIGQVYQTLSRLERQGLVRSATVTQESRPDKKVYELTAAGREGLQRWVDEVVPAARIREGFLRKLVLAWKTRLADPVMLMDRQRRAYLLQLRELNELADTATGLVARLAVEAAVLHVQADLKLLEYCEQAVSAGDTGPGG
jgi:DNA-binding PadR family transcriptional regulator